ncbi:hypothetical protein CcaverHIS631_0411620 [Cutaneotrichosporon cavernicola]|nr:hypothetical protein CcaverHIS631_0411620 [Cutaneotrichosporon cavernicola]
MPIPNMANPCPLAGEITNAESILWHRWKHFHSVSVAHGNSIAQLHALQQSNMGGLARPILLLHAENYVNEMSQAVTRAHQTFQEQLDAVEGMYGAHSMCPCHQVLYQRGPPRSNSPSL